MKKTELRILLVNRYLSIALSFLFIILFPVGCDSRSGDVSSLSAGDIIQSCLDAQVRVTTFRSQVHSSIETYFSDRPSQSITITATLDSAFDMAGQRLTLDGEASVSMSGEKSVTGFSTIIDGTTLYSRESRESGWTERTLTESERTAVWTEQMDLQSTSGYTGILDTTTDMSVRRETRYGIECYRIDAEPDITAVNDILRSQLLPGAGAMGFIADEDMEDIIRQVNIVYWIAQDTSNLVEYQLTAELETEIEGKTVLGTIKNSGTFTGFGEPVVIELPAVASSSN